MARQAETFCHIITCMKKWRPIIITLLIAVICLSAWAKVSIDIGIKGISGPALNNIKQRLALAQDSMGKEPSNSAIKTFYDQSPDHILKALEPYGYFKPTIKSSWFQQGQKYRFNYVIYPGPAMTIRSIQLHFTGPGKYLAELTTARQKIPLKPGDILLIDKYNQMKRNVMHVARNHGYLDAKWTTAKLLINRNSYQADIELVLDTGSQYYFGPITYSKVIIGKPLLLRLTPFRPGEPFSADKLLQLQDNLASVNYFEHIKVDANPEKALSRHVPVNVELAMKKRQAYTIGLGYGTDTGVRGTLGVDLRYLNASGHHFEAQINASQVKNVAYAQYIIPGKNPITDQYTITASIFNEDTQSADGLAEQLSFAYVFTKNDWQRLYALSDIYSKNTDLDPANLANEITSFSNVLYPSFDWRMLHVYDQIDTPSGYRFNFRTLGAAEPLLSSLSFFQVRLDSKSIFPVFTHDRIAVSGSLAYNSTNDLKLPVALRLFAGGTETLRGYSFESIPNVGVARYLYVGSLEFQKRIYPEWYVGIFYDMGDAAVGFPSHIKQDAGLSIVRTTPIGTIEVGAAQSFGPDSQKIQFILSVGPDL